MDGCLDANLVSSLGAVEASASIAALLRRRSLCCRPEPALVVSCGLTAPSRLLTQIAAVHTIILLISFSFLKSPFSF